MRKLLFASAVTLTLAALPTSAQAFDFCGWQIDGGAKVWLRVRHSCCGGGSFGGEMSLPQAGPWYLYWPMEAHFQTPAPGASAYFGQMALPPNFGQGGGGYGAPSGHGGPAPHGYGMPPQSAPPVHPANYYARPVVYWPR